MARRQSVVMVLVPVLADPEHAHLRALDQQLADIADDVRRNRHLCFDDLTTVHFARFVLLPPARDGGPPRLLFSSVYDGTIDDHLAEWIEVAGAALDTIFAHCEGYPTRALDRPHAVRDYLLAHRISYDAFYRGHPDRTVPQVSGELAVRAVVARQLDGLTAQDPVATRQALRRAIGDHVDVCWALAKPAKPRRPPPRARDLPALGLIVGLLGLLVWHPLVSVTAIAVLAAAFGALALAIRSAERREGAGTRASVDASHHLDLVKREDLIEQNQLTHLVELKPGRVRHVALRLMLWVVDVLARYFYTKGHLRRIPTIHFAHWTIIDGGRRLLFLSNYDGSWESYLGDFIDFAADGLTGIWSNTVGFPPSRWMFWDGALREQEFKAWTRAHQIPTQLWYSGYRDLSVANVNRNSEVRRGLAGPEQRPPDKQWADQLFA